MYNIILYIMLPHKEIPDVINEAERLASSPIRDFSRRLLSLGAVTMVSMFGASEAAATNRVKGPHEYTYAVDGSSDYTCSKGKLAAVSLRAAEDGQVRDFSQTQDYRLIVKRCPPIRNEKNKTIKVKVQYTSEETTEIQQKWFNFRFGKGKKRVMGETFLVSRHKNPQPNGYDLFRVEAYGINKKRSTATRSGKNRYAYDRKLGDNSFTLGLATIPPSQSIFECYKGPGAEQPVERELADDVLTKSKAQVEAEGGTYIDPAQIIDAGISTMGISRLRLNLEDGRTQEYYDNFNYVLSLAQAKNLKVMVTLIPQGVFSPEPTKDDPAVLSYSNITPTSMKNAAQNLSNRFGSYFGHVIDGVELGNELNHPYFNNKEQDIDNISHSISAGAQVLKAIINPNLRLYAAGLAPSRQEAAEHLAAYSKISNIDRVAYHPYDSTVNFYPFFIDKIKEANNGKLPKPIASTEYGVAARTDNQALRVQHQNSQSQIVERALACYDPKQVDRRLTYYQLVLGEKLHADTIPATATSPRIPGVWNTGRVPAHSIHSKQSLADFVLPTSS